MVDEIVIGVVIVDVGESGEMGFWIFGICVVDVLEYVGEFGVVV